MSWLTQLDLGESSGNVSLGTYIEEAEFLRGLLLKTTREVRALSKTTLYAKRVKLLMGIPGIGCLTAMVILTELDNITRFTELDKLCSYVGLIPNVSGSGESERIGDITKRGNKMLRKMLVERSWVAIRKDPALTLKYNELRGRMKANKSIIRIARKLLNRIRYVLVNEEEYQMSVVA